MIRHCGHFKEPDPAVSALVEAKDHSEGKMTLKTHEVKDLSDLNISPDEIVHIREKFNTPRGVFAHLLHTYSRTLEHWKIGSKEEVHLMVRQ